MNNEVIEILKNAKQLIENGWTKYASARDKNGKVIDLFDKEASSFCIIGAITKSSINCINNNNNYMRACMLLRNELKYKNGVYRKSLQEYNDSVYTRKHDVLKLFDATISRLEKAEDHA